MKVYFPAYYKNFKCIADKCRHSCCIGWEIGIDDETLVKYRNMQGPLGEDIRSNLNEEDSVIIMKENRCPFLDDCGLCRIITAAGEDNISIICREHPRFYHRILDRIEGGIGASCEEACRIILTSEDFLSFVEVEASPEPSYFTDFDSISHRSEILSLLDNNASYCGAVEAIAQRYNIPDLKKIDWREALDSHEYLDESRVGKFSADGRDYREISQKYLTRFLSYLVFRHVSIAENYDDLRARVAFCLLLSHLFEDSLSRTEATLDDAVEAARVISEEIEYSEDNTASLIMEMWGIV